MMNLLLRRALCLLLLCQLSRGQYYDEQGGGEDYQDYADDSYGQDNLYADYANRQAAKEAGGGGGPGMGKTIAFCAGSWFLGGKIHSKRAVAKVSKKFKKEQKELYLQYYKDVMALQQQNAELAQYVDQVTLDQLDGEFAAADTNNDNKVSRAEFNMYKNTYLAKHPEMASQFPRFEDFDPDSNGLISKAEYDQYYARMLAR
uniref:EF-hand domain-containing protein n=1 Tax=Minutocellus polymorphus TaxID=265543 RepID=A0A6U0LUN8_9STRA|mmetsp:Transcript_13/g.46  ORF Transcript_13/g.46 Transcript_13/m.46 type:complete len:202 (+) Transcript_13:138-743(+)